MTRLLFLILFALTLHAADYYASPTGSPSGDGSISAPWDLATGCNQPLAQTDTLNLLGGTYPGTFTCTWSGVIQSAPGQWARIDVATGDAITLTGSDTILQDLEIFSSTTTHQPNTGIVGVQNLAPRSIVRHLIIHDTNLAIGDWHLACDSRTYGNLLYYNGYASGFNVGGNGIYVQSEAPCGKQIQDNVVLNNFGIGVQAYTQGGRLDNITFRGNAVAQNGSMGPYEYVQLFAGGYVAPTNPVWDSNYTYDAGGTTQSPSAASWLGYGTPGSIGGLLTGNIFVGGDALYVYYAQGLTMTGNTIAGAIAGFTKSQYPANTYTAPPLTVRVRADQDIPKRGFVVVYNLNGKAKTVQADVTSMGYTNGQQARVTSAENPFGPSILATVASGKITIPLTGWTVAAPINWPTPRTVLPRFGVFLVQSP